MAKKRGILYVFDIQNEQEQYAECLEFISILHDKNAQMSQQERLNRICALAEGLEISGGFAPDVARNYYEQPLKSNGRPNTPIVFRTRKVEAKNVQASILSNDSSALHFHIRIHFQRTDCSQIDSLSNLQYLALFLQRLKQIGQADFFKRLSIFIVPMSGNYYPFQQADGSVDLESYKTVSHFLRLLSKEYTGIIYGVQQQNNECVVRALNFQNSTRFTNYFPLIPLTEKTYSKLFDEGMEQNTFEALCALKSRQRFQKAADEDPYTALSSFILETAFFQLTSTLMSCSSDGKRRILRLINEELTAFQRNEQVWLITFSVFLFTLRIDHKCEQVPAEELRSIIRQNLEFSDELCAGLRQLAQNTLQHSASHEGVFSFYLNHCENAENGDTLRVFLSDFNDQQSFIDNFATNIREEAKHTDNWELKQRYLKLANQKEVISLGNFFGEYESEAPQAAWRDFRQADSSAHVGLLLFSLTMQRCKGCLTLINSTDYSISPQNIFSHSYSNDSSKFACAPSPEQHIIPGTQLVISIPVGAIEDGRPRGIGQLSLPRPIHEDYNTFATYLDYLPNEIPFYSTSYNQILRDTKMDSALPSDCPMVADAAAKFQAIHCWEKYWRKFVFPAIQDVHDRMLVHYIDTAKLPSGLLNSSDKIEIFIKGFINALDALCLGNHDVLWAFTNVSPSFFRIFRQISIVLAPKSFPSGLQLYIVEVGLDKSIHLLGDSFSRAVTNAYTLSLEHGTQSFNLSEMDHSRALFRKAMGAMPSNRAQKECVTQLAISVCPFDVILPDPNDGVLSIFDKRILQLADRPIDEFPSGCKLDNIHMRLGSKVHIHAFYEMAFLFYRTAIANRVAFEILKDLTMRNSENPIDLKKDDLLFYGYASYSKALLTSLQEILKAYRSSHLRGKLGMEKDKEMRACLLSELGSISSHLAIASYQHNLQTEFQADDTELYFDFHDSILGEYLGENRARLNRPVKIIQIVPISSTLTTFDKMERKLQSSIASQYGIETAARYTVFWVTDAKATSYTEPRAETEAKYWVRVEPSQRRIQIDPQNTCFQNDIFYFMRSPVEWEDPLKCELCYPTDTIGEVPLVETDQTSTVPTQQVRAWRAPIQTSAKDHHENDMRLLDMKFCVSYGHFRRENNHFQFYLETQSYFNRVSPKLAEWLSELRKQDNEVCDLSKPVLNIIFSPEHATNVGFAQYVNNYYFMGNAEIVCINEDKEYRSNFKCEHMALIHAISDLLNSASESSDPPVRFYFVDDTIISGDTFHKANSFLHSLIPAQYQHLFPANLFRKCFLLVDRLSVESKQAYVRDVEKDFLSYLHIDLSNMRTQGDSCVACKLKSNAETLLRRSATQNIAQYWYAKANQYTVHRYNKHNCADTNASERAFRKLVMAHITQNVFFHDNASFKLGEIYDSILAVLAEILGVPSRTSVSFQYGLLMQEVRESGDLEPLKDYLKLIARPFFSFDFKVRLQVLTFILVLAEYLIDGENFSAEKLKNRKALYSNPYKAFLFEGSRIDESFRLFRIIKEKYLSTKDLQIDFIQDCLIDNLVELRSTYLMRKDTMTKMYRFLLVDQSNGRPKEHEKADAFWKEYIAGIHKILDCNSDETRALWLEHLLIRGEEYGALENASEAGRMVAEQPPRPIYQVLSAGTDAEQDLSFRHFCHELFLQNNRVLFDSLEHHQKNNGTGAAYSMEYSAQWRILDTLGISVGTDPSVEELALFKEVYGEPLSNLEVKKRYDNLLNKIVAMGKRKYGFIYTDIALITILPGQKNTHQENVPRIGELDFVSWKLDTTVDSYFNKYEIKCKLIQALSDKDHDFSLNEYGYSLYPGANGHSPYMFVFFKSDIYPIVPVYLYFSFKESQRNEYDIFFLNLFLRDILSYRNQFLQILQNDFAGDIFPKYAHTAGEKSILAHEKATSHNTTGDDQVTLEVFVDPKSAAKYEILDSNQVLKWLLLHNYNNAQIAKLFNRSYRQSEEYDRSANFPVPPPLYPEDVPPEIMRKLSWHERPLRSFSDLRLLEDGRFALLESAVTLECDALRDVQFLVNPEKKAHYNIEYFKNIIIDIVISAMKYGTVSASYLERVDKYLKGRNLLRHEAFLSEEQTNMLKQQKCVIECCIDRNIAEPFDYLVIRNRVNKLAHNLFDWEKHNQIIIARIENPIDYADGHMSLLAISQYIEGLWPEKLYQKTSFAYREIDSQLYFETRLPVIKKEDVNA